MRRFNASVRLAPPETSVILSGPVILSVTKNFLNALMKRSVPVYPTITQTKLFVTLFTIALFLTSVSTEAHVIQMTIRTAIIVTVLQNIRDLFAMKR